MEETRLESRTILAYVEKIAAVLLELLLAFCIVLLPLAGVWGKTRGLLL